MLVTTPKTLLNVGAANPYISMSENTDIVQMMSLGLAALMVFSQVAISQNLVSHSTNGLIFNLYGFAIIA